LSVSFRALPPIVGFVLVLAPSGAAQEISYNRDIRPILSKNCFRCHGPDEAQRKAKMRLDLPGKAKTAPVVERITSKDRSEVMPPPSSGKSLTPGQLDLLKRWVSEGAHYEKHWSFVKPTKSALPRVKGEGVRHPIDRFVRARLEREGLESSPPTDKLTLARRVYLDLIGLPPTPKEADAFANDDSTDAFEKLVDRLLASPRYGERWARRWLDLARYADTNGYEKDRGREIWAYRDWVIRARNADMPFDQFTIEQIAGDMLPNATPSQFIATGFHRNTMLNEEGGIDPLEFRFHAMTDRVATTGTVFLGLTIGCAQCHTHKFDPVTHRQYYEFMAFLDNADEPDYFIPETNKIEKHREDVSKAKAMAAELASKWPKTAGSLEARVSAWIQKNREHSARWTTLVPKSATTNLPLLTVEADGVIFASGDTSKHDTYQLRFPAVDHEIVALRLEALPDDRLPARGPGMTYYEGTKGDFYLSEFKLRADGKPVKIKTATHSYAVNCFGKKPVSAQLAVDGDLQTGWSVHGRTGQRHVADFKLDVPIPAGMPIEIEMHFGRHFGSSLGKFRISATARPKGHPNQSLSAEIDRLLGLSDDELTAAGRARLRDEFLSTVVEMARFNNSIRELRRPPRFKTTLIFRERLANNPRPTHRHHRGEFLQPKERVTPGVPEFLHAFPATAKRDRLGFARWLVSEDNPLAARVVVNRHWAALFGRGIVRTLEDFGAQGELPTHPQLLDWLAAEFMASGWSLKKLHRLIVTSATYRQSSVVRPDSLERDPDNRWLSRAPRFRLEAEIIRDSALRAAGILNDKMFGSPVRPPQPKGVTEVAYGNPRWHASAGKDRYRRSIYTYAKRTAPFALYNTFDAPSGEACTARRDVSNTALQALTLMNDPMMTEIGRALGKRLAAHAEKHDAKWLVRRAFRLVLTRGPSDREVESLSAFARRAAGRFKNDIDAAKKVAGETANRPAECATWTAVARALLSLDETITRN
jgi:hypothetical protein